MTNTLRSNQQVVVAGLGLTGQACLRFLLRQGVNVKAWDSRDTARLPDDITVELTRSDVPDNYFDNVSELVVSPGLSLAHPIVARAKAADVTVIGDVELFARYNKAPLVAVTGSNGKTTVALLTTHILKACGINACAAGNVGKPVLETLTDDFDAIVLELSSFQLESTHSLALRAACLLNISDDHLDRHGTMDAYLAAKQRIFLNAEQAIVWREQSQSAPADNSVSRVSFGLGESAEGFGVHHNHITWQGEPLVDLARVQLTGMHNALNIQAALGLAMALGVALPAAADAVYSFAPVAHRCTTISERFGIRWIDDSKATNVGATLAALDGLAPGMTGKLILIAGGDAKGADLEPLRAPLEKFVSAVVTLGRDGEKLGKLHCNTVHTQSMKDAVRRAREFAVAGDTVLLSPACASLDMFDNYEHRARVFASEIEELAA